MVTVRVLGGSLGGVLGCGLGGVLGCGLGVGFVSVCALLVDPRKPATQLLTFLQNRKKPEIS